MMCACARVTRGARDARDVRCSRPPPPPPSPTPHHVRATDRASERRRRRHARSMDPPSLPGSGTPPLRARARMRERVRVHAFGACSRRPTGPCLSTPAASARRRLRRSRWRPFPRRLMRSSSDRPWSSSPPQRVLYTSAASAMTRTSSALPSLFGALQSDISRFALCPNDHGMLRGLVRDVGAAVMRSAKPNTARKDRSAWRKWVAFCRMLNTPEMRTCVDAHSGVDAFGARRERFMQAAFLCMLSAPWFQRTERTRRWKTMTTQR